MRIPSNLIKKGKYTSGNEFVIVSSKKTYQGYYYELNNKFFAGKEFNSNAPELAKIKATEVNLLLTRAATYVYGALSGAVLNNKKPTSFLQGKNNSTRYFIKKLNFNPILIKEVDKITFDQFKIDPIYQTISLSYDPKTGFNSVEIEEANKSMNGLKEFINNLNFNPTSDNDSYPVGQG
jgi:hypothetical protein